MERLTVRTPEGVALKMKCTYLSDDAARKAYMENIRIAIERLADYEDTGKAPEEVNNLVNESHSKNYFHGISVPVPAIFDADSFRRNSYMTPCMTEIHCDGYRECRSCDDYREEHDMGKTIPMCRQGRF